MEETKICSKCGIRKPLTEFHKNGFDKLGNQKYRGYCKTCANKRESDRYWEKKAFIESQKNACIKCGDTRSYVLDFHHIDSATKDFTIGQYKKGSQQTIQNEINKCVVLCANCHREFHYLEKNQHITLEQYLTNNYKVGIV